MFGLRRYVSLVQYKLEDEFLEWNAVVPDVGGVDEEERSCSITPALAYIMV